MAPGYIYEPLPHARSIRVMVLEPAGDSNDPLVARLETLHLGPHIPRAAAPPRMPGERRDHYDRRERIWDAQTRPQYVARVLESSLPYTALSYSWATQDGDQSPTRPLTLGGRQVFITPNLSDGLRRLRSPTTAHRWWVDAVCIDQSNLAERNAQVAMMADIYKLARRCTVWLGEGPTADHDRIIWQLFHCSAQKDAGGPCFPSVEYQRRHHVAAWEALFAVRHARCSPRKCNGGHTFVQAAGGRTREPPSVQEVSDIMSAIEAWSHRRYWDRRWVLQENASREDRRGTVRFCWGQYRINFHGMSKLLALLDTLMIKGGELSKGSHPLQITHIRSVIICTRGGGDGLCRLLRLQSHMHCQDPRDRLYSLLPMDTSFDLHADYTLPTRQVCITFAKALVRRGDFHRLLPAVNADVLPALDLPSWVVDLRGTCNLALPLPGGDDPLNAVCNDELQLSCDLRFIGNVVGVDDDERREVLVDACGLRRAVGATDTCMPGRLRLAHAEPSRWHAPFLPVKGDAMYSTQTHDWYHGVLWLRPTGDGASSLYRLVQYALNVHVKDEGLQMDACCAMEARVTIV